MQHHNSEADQNRNAKGRKVYIRDVLRFLENNF